MNGYDEGAMNRTRANPPNGFTPVQRNISHYAPFDEQTSSGSSDSSTSSTSDYDLKVDHTSGQDMAASLTQALLDEKADELQMLMKDPIAAIATGDRIRNLSRMIQAYKGGYDLPDLEIIPHSRVAAESFGNRTTTQSSSGGKTAGGKGWKKTHDTILENNQ
jgi:hypothetical protein